MGEACRHECVIRTRQLEARLAEVEAERNMWRRKFWEANGDKYIEHPTPGEGDRG